MSNDRLKFIEQKLAKLERQKETLIVERDKLPSYNKTPSERPQSELSTDQNLHKLLSESGIDTVVLRGSMGAKELKKANEKLLDTQVIVATGKYIGEGFDLARLDTLFLAMPVSWKGSLAQYAGRIYRESKGKDQVTIFDYVDSSLPMLQRMFKKREKGYKLMGYEINDD